MHFTTEQFKLSFSLSVAFAFILGSMIFFAAFMSSRLSNYYQNEQLAQLRNQYQHELVIAKQAAYNLQHNHVTTV